MTSTRVCYALPIWKLAQSEGLKKSRLTMKGDDDHCLVSSSVYRHILPTALPSQNAMLSEGSVKGCRRYKHKRYSPCDYHCAILRRRRRWQFSSPTRLNSLIPWSSLDCRLDNLDERVRDSCGNIFLERYFTKFEQKLRVWPEEITIFFSR